MSHYPIHTLKMAGYPTAAYAVNKNGIVVGTAELEPGFLRPVIWELDWNGIWAEAPPWNVPLAASSLLGNMVVLNDAGDVACTYRDPDNGVDFAYVNMAVPGGPGSLKGVFKGQPHGVVDINDSGIVLGILEESPGVLRAYLYDTKKGTVEYLPFFGKLPVTMPTSINNKGQVVGTAADGKGDVEQPFLYDGEMHPLGDPGYLPACINDEGQVVGSRLGGGYLCETANGALQFKHISAEAIRQDAYAWPTRINNKGDIVGSWTALSPDDQGLFICKAGTTQALNLETLLPTFSSGIGGNYTPWRLPYTYAVDIGDGGHIVGVGDYKHQNGFDQRGFRLVPKPLEVTAVTPPEVGTAPPVTELGPQARPPKAQAAAVDPLAVVLPPEVYRRLKLPDPAPFHAARARLRHALHALDPARKQHMESRLETLSMLMRLLQRDLKGGGTNR